MTLSKDVRAVYIEIDAAATEAVRRDWHVWGQGAALVTLPSPFRSLLEPLLEYIEEQQRADPNGYVTVVLPTDARVSAKAAPAGSLAEPPRPGCSLTP